MMAPSSRRRFVGALAAITASGAAALPTVAAAHPDAELLELGRRFDILTPAHDAAWDHMSDLEEAFKPVPRPDVLGVTRRDFFSGIVGGNRLGEGSGGWTQSAIDELRTKKFTRHLVNGGTANPDGSFTPRAVPDEWANTRAAEVVAAWDTWVATVTAAENSCGLTSAREEARRLTNAHSALRLQIAAAPISTLDGVIVKARSAFWCFGEVDDVTDPNAEDLAASLTQDIVRLADRRET